MLHVTLGAVVLVAALGACDQQNPAAEPADAVVAAGSANEVTPIKDAAQLVALRKVTARFQNLSTAMEAGYSAQITPCWAHHSAGAMGYHYGNTSLFDATVDLLQPELVIYEPLAGGHMRLVGMEYLVPLDAWAAAGHDLNDPADVPVLLGQKYTRHSFLPIFKLHIWLWQKNPSGTFADWNPDVSCQYADSTEIF